MALNWCRSAAKLRAFPGCSRVRGCVLRLCDNNESRGITPSGTRGITQYVQHATRSRQQVKYLEELYRRRMEVGPDTEHHPSKLQPWNAETERYAFGQRLGEDFDDKWLRLAFRCSSLREAEIEKNTELGISIETVVADNTELVEQGDKFAQKVIEAYLRFSFPDFLEEGIKAVRDHLLSDDTLMFIGQNFGLTDLMESSSYPPLESEYMTTFLAVIGALLRSQGEERTTLFILDFIAPQLVGKDVCELWKVENPMGVVAGILERQGRGPPEARALFTSGRNTLMAVYNVGIYCDKKLIGKSPGETQIIAEEMAARDALKNLMNLQDNRPPMILGDQVRNITLDFDKVNTSVTEVLQSVKRKTKRQLRG